MAAAPIQLDILVHVRRAEAQSPAVRVGLALAQRLRAWATGLEIVPIAPAAFASPEAVALYVGEADSLYQEALDRGAFWREQLAGAGVQGEWQVSQGDTVEALCHASRWADLLVMERPLLNRDAPTGWGLVSRTLLAASAPLVVVPETASWETVGRHPVVAWNQSRESMLAIHGALPILRQAETVTVLVGDPGENPFGLRYLPHCDLRAWLTRRGIDARFEPFTAARDRGAALLDTVRARHGDLIVMGAWGKSRLAELVLGGTTRHLFQHSHVPLLAAH